MQTHRIGAGPRIPFSVSAWRYRGARGHIYDTGSRPGDFSGGLRRWLFTSDQHWLWHADNLAVHLLVEQGWLGLVAFTLLVLYAGVRLAAALGRGEPHAAVLGAALLGLVGEGAAGSVLDAPRVASLAYLLIFAALAVTRALSASLRGPAG